MDFKNVDLSKIDLNNLSEDDRKRIQDEFHIIILDPKHMALNEAKIHINGNAACVANNVPEGDDYYLQSDDLVQWNGFKNGAVVAVIDYEYYNRLIKGMPEMQLQVIKEIGATAKNIAKYLDNVIKKYNLPLNKYKPLERKKDF